MIWNIYQFRGNLKCPESESIEPSYVHIASHLHEGSETLTPRRDLYGNEDDVRKR